MKYMVVLADGMADYPIKELDSRTPLEYAKTPWLDKLARQASIGMVQTIPEGFPPGSDVANLAVLGYDPRIYYTGRSPLEAVSMGVELGEADLALRCNLVTLSDEGNYAQKTMLDYSAGEISSEEAHQLIAALNAHLGNKEFRFHPGISYRHLMLWKNGGERQVDLTPPHDISDRIIGSYLPQGQDGSILLDLMERSALILQDHPVNEKRRQQGKSPAVSAWFWGEGRKPQLTSFRERFGLEGSVVAAVDLVRGLGISAGLTPVAVPGATGGVETNFAGKGEAALKELKGGRDFVFLHIESADEAGHQGNLQAKIWSIEQIDREVIRRIVEALPDFEDLHVMVLPDHPTPLSLRTHSSDPVPFLIYRKSQPAQAGPEIFHEKAAAQGVFVKEGFTLMERFINPAGFSAADLR